MYDVAPGPHLAVDQCGAGPDDGADSVLELALRYVLFRGALAERADAVVPGDRPRDADLGDVLDDAVAVGAAADVSRQRHHLVADGLDPLVDEARHVRHVFLDDPGGLLGALDEVLFAGRRHARYLPGEELLGGLRVAEDYVLLYLLRVRFLLVVVVVVAVVELPVVRADAAVVLAAGRGRFDIVAPCQISVE